MKSHKHIWTGITIVVLLMGGCSSERPNTVVSNVTNSPPVVVKHSTVATQELLASNATLVIPLPTNKPTRIIAFSNATPAVLSTQTVSTTNPAVDLTSEYEKYQKGQITKGEMIQSIWAADNNTPINMYGKVIDQHGQPVVGAKVKGSIMLIADADRSRGEDHFTETDGEGRFKFVGLHGIELGVWPQKEGYDYDLYLSAKRPDNYYKSDPSNPVIFKMWKLKGAEPMIHTELDSRIPYDGTSAVFDLTTGQKFANGDLRITLLRNPLHIQRGRDKFNWTVKIEILNGGILPENDLYPNWAPDSGYQNSFEASVKAAAVPWTQNLSQSFYFRTAQRQYGRLFIDLTTDSMRPDTGISVQAWINPSGSQNLEFDRAKQIQ